LIRESKSNLAGLTDNNKISIDKILE